MTISAAHTLEPPFFVIGSPRSGTTLLRLMLTSHPQLVVPPECGFAVWLHPMFGQWKAEEFRDRGHVLRFAEAVASCRKFETWGISASHIAEAIVRDHPDSYGNACACIYRAFCARIGKSTASWGDKNNYYLSHMSIIRTIFPQARFIHIVRDGRDIACSYREVMTIRSNSPYRPLLPVAIDEIAEQWVHDIQTIRRQSKTMGSNSFMEVRYEDLTTHPKIELLRICAWLGVNFASAMLHFDQENLFRHLEPAAVTSDTVGRYAWMLDESDIARFEDIAADELRHYGYLQQDRSPAEAIRPVKAD
jgi:hypothetical protein